MGTYSIIYLKNPEMAEEINDLLKERYNLQYETHNGVEYGIFFTQEMFNQELRFINQDEKGKTYLSHYTNPISIETYASLIFRAGYCFGNIVAVCIKISGIADKDF